MSSLFISYRRSDSPGSVSIVHDRLKARLPRWTLFYDHDNLKAGEDFPERLRQEVTSAAVVLILVGPRWVDSLKERRNRPGIDHVREEVRLALQAGHKVIPVLVENAAMPGEADLADYPEILPLLRLNGRVVRPDPDFETDTERLAAFLDELGPGVGAGTILGGKYKILREIGQGGMGVVFEAEQIHPKRSVAVKMILEGMDSKEVLARFDGEKEALARFDHPNIAGVIDSGASPSGKPYFVMEFVKGEPITAYCDRKKMATCDRLELFRLVCSAVQHAHQKGIIHRDIKPSNVLVEEIDGTPVPKVIDFGLAKALAGKLTDKTLISESGQTVGTLIYSSPEQAAGRTYDIDTRTDIYSLGVLLYELLAGEPPFTEQHLKEVGDEAMKREIREQEPSKPSTKLSSSNRLPTIAANRQLDPAKLTRLVRGELDWIVMRALEKEAKRRYDTANGLAMDIQRFLADEPVEAGPPSAGYRLRKFVRRNRGPVAAGMVVLVVLAAGIVGTTFGLFEARSSERLAKGEKKRADEEARNAKRQEEIAEEKAGEALKQEGIAKDKAEQALKARNELAKTNDELAGSLARALRGPIGVDARIMALTPYEVDAFHEIAARRGSSVSYRFLDDATRAPSTCKQLANRAEFVLQAAIGLDPELRARAERLLRDRLENPDLPEKQRIDLALVWCRSEWSSPEMDLFVAMILARTIIDARILGNSGDQTEALGTVAGRLDPRQAAELCEKASRPLAQAMARSNLSMLSHKMMSQSLGPLADRLEPAKTAQMYDRVVRHLIEAVGRTTQTFDRTYIADTIAPVASRLEPRKVAVLCDTACGALLDEMGKTRDAVNLSRLARDVAAVAGWMESAKAAEVCNEAGRLLTEAMGKTKDEGALSQLAWGLATVAGRMEPNAAARTLTTQITKTGSLDVVGHLAHGLVPVLNRMEPATAVVVCEQTAGHIARALASGGVKLSVLPYLTEGLGATAARLEPRKAAALCTEAASNLARMITNDPSQSAIRLNWLAESLTFLVGRMEPGKAAEVCGKVVPDLAVGLANEANLFDMGRLAQSVVALASHMEPGEAVASRDQATRALIEAMGMITSSAAHQRAILYPLISCLAAATLGLSPGDFERATHSALLVFDVLGSPHQLLSTPPVLPVLGHLRPRPLPPQTLVDLLKHPFCVGEARRAVLNALAFTYHRPFVDQWEFVHFVQENKLTLDLLGPPKRPQQDVSEKLAKDDPRNAQAQRDLAVSLIKFGDMQLESGDAKAALASYQRSLGIREKMAKDDPKNTRAQRDLSVSLFKVAEAQSRSGDAKASLTTYQRSLGIREKLLAANALDAGDIYDTACAFALCVPLADEPEKKENYAKRAVELLSQAAAKGFKDVAHVRQDTDLDPLRQRDDFKKFLAELAAKTAPTKEPSNEKK